MLAHVTPQPLWHIASPHADMHAIAARFNLHHIATQVWLNRLEDSSQADALHLDPQLKHLPSPETLQDIDVAVRLLKEAIHTQTPICVYGDYDVDGTSSTAILVENLRALGAQVGYYLPHRLLQGYGLHQEAVDHIYQQGFRLLLTCDLGISNAEEVRYAKTLGLQVIVVDHHQVPERLPMADAVINPHRPDDKFAFKPLCAAGVCFYLLIALRAHFRKEEAFEPPFDLKKSLDLVALATVADMVPLNGVNRILVSRGLSLMRQHTRSGLAALARISRVDLTSIDAQDLAFKIAPRVNAAGRMGSAMRCVELFLSSSLQSTQLAAELEAENDTRRAIEDEVYQHACRQAEEMLAHSARHGLVVYHPHWHPGVVGIVASRLVERYFLPTIVVGQGGKGSARSSQGLHILEAIRAASQHLVKFGGHHHAAGVTVRQGEEAAFQKAFNDAIATLVATQGARAPVLDLDAVLPIADLNVQLLKDLERVGPYGAGYREPLFALLGAEVKQRRIVGKDHLKLTLKNGTEAIGFRLAEAEQAHLDVLDLAVTPFINEFAGNKSLALRIKALRAPVDAH